MSKRPEAPELKEMIAENIWHTNLRETFEAILECAVEDDYRWTWARNTECKYVDIRIDMRDGGHILKDRSGKRITIEQLKWQYKSEDES